MAAASRARRSRASSRCFGIGVGRRRPPTPRLVGRRDLAAGTNQRSRRARALRRSRQPLMRIRVNQTSNGQASRYDVDVREHLDERVLDRFVGFGGVAQVLIGDARRAPLMQRRRARRTARAPRPSRRARRVRGSRPRAASRRTTRPARRRRAGRRLGGRAEPAERRRRRRERSRIVTHRALRCDRAGVYSLPHLPELLTWTDPQRVRSADSAYVTASSYLRSR